MDSNVPARLVNEPMEVVSASEPAAPAPVNPLLVVHSLLRGRYALAITLAILGAAIGGPVGYFAMEPEYRSVGIIRIEAQGQRLLLKTEENSMMPMFDAYLSSQVAQISSRRLIALAMQEPEWKQTGRGLVPEEIAKFEKSLQVYNPRGTALIQIAFNDTDPKIASVGVRSIIKAYEDYYKVAEETRDQGKVTQLEELERKLQDNLIRINDQIQVIAGDYGAATIQGIFQSRLTDKSAIKSRLDMARIQRAVANAGLGVNQTAGPTTKPSQETIDVVLARDPELQGLRQLRAGQDLERRRLLSRYGEGHPRLLDIEMNLQFTDESIRERSDELVRLVEVTPLDAQGMSLSQLQANEEFHQKLLDELNQEITTLTAKTREIERWRGEAQLAQEHLNLTKQRLAEIRTEVSRAGKMTIISEGDLPYAPEKDRRRALTAVGSLGMAGVGVGFVLLLGFFDRRLRHVDRARSHLPQVGRVLGVLPELPTDQADPTEAAESAFCVHHIRAMVQIHQRSTGRKVFAITSPSPGDGKTSLTIALGMSLASSGSSTLVVDCDFDGGGLSSRLGLADPNGPRTGRSDAARQPGLVDVLRGHPLDQAIAPTGFPNLSKLPLGAVPGTHSGQVSPGQLRRILAPLAARFDIVLVDCGPILGSIEAAITAAEVDSVILVVSRESDRVAAEHAANLLITAGSNIEGIVFNRARPADVAKSSYHSSASFRSMRSTSASSTTAVNP